MKILALDTATEGCSVALLLDDVIIERGEVAPRGHADLILPMVDEVLTEANVKLSHLDALAFDRGPGSFTGVRIGTSVAQGLAFGSDLMVSPISSLAALAWGVFRESGHTEVLALIDARMDEVYWAAFRCDERGVNILVEEQVTPPEQVQVPTGAWVGVGSGWASYAQRLQHLLVLKIEAERLPQARDVARLGRNAVTQGKLVRAEAALPVYLRNKVAWAKS